MSTGILARTFGRIVTEAFSEVSRNARWIGVRHSVHASEWASACKALTTSLRLSNVSFRHAFIISTYTQEFRDRFNVWWPVHATSRFRIMKSDVIDVKAHILPIDPGDIINNE
jgi:hypothetical protein